MSKLKREGKFEDCLIDSEIFFEYLVDFSKKKTYFWTN